MTLILGILVGFIIIALIWLIISIVTWGDAKEYEEELNKICALDDTKKDNGGSN